MLYLPYKIVNLNDAINIYTTALQILLTKPTKSRNELQLHLQQLPITRSCLHVQLLQKIYGGHIIPSQPEI